MYYYYYNKILAILRCIRVCLCIEKKCKNILLWLLFYFKLWLLTLPVFAFERSLILYSFSFLGKDEFLFFFFLDFFRC